MNAADHGGRMRRPKKTAAVVTESNDAAATLPSPAHHSVEVPPAGALLWAGANDPTKARTYPFALQRNKPRIDDSNHKDHSPKGNGPGRRKCNGIRVADHTYNLGFDSAPAVWYWQVRAETHHVCAPHVMIHCARADDG